MSIHVFDNCTNLIGYYISVIKVFRFFKKKSVVVNLWW